MRGWRGQNNNNKTTFIQVWVTQAALSSHGLLTSGLGTPNDTLLLLRVELPFPRSLCTMGISRQGHSATRVLTTGGVVGRSAGLGLGLSTDKTTSLWWEALQHPRPIHAELGGRDHDGSRGRNRLGVIQQHTHSAPGLCNAAFNHQRIWMQM